MRPFRWHDGERVILFEAGAGSHAWPNAELLTTARALPAIPDAVRETATAVHEVPAGGVPEAAAALDAAVRGERIVAWGGGRVIDTAKALAAARGGRVCAVPTTLSGAEMTRGGRSLPGHESASRERPALVLADPGAMESAPVEWLRLSAMNALAHAAEALIAAGANPVASMAALRGAELLVEGLDVPRSRGRLALGSLLAAYALDSAGYALHHVLCQTIVRTAGTGHAATNACMLPRTLLELSDMFPHEMYELGEAIGIPVGALPQGVARLAGGAHKLSELGVDRALLLSIAEAAAGRSELRSLPRVPDATDLLELLERSW
ncbi:MAG: iron-containing alcohol dehydrogenase [Gaiellales bacterium]